MIFPCQACELTQPEPLMTHLAENHEANCQTEKQGRNGENGVPISLRSVPLSLLAASSRNAAAGVYFELSYPRAAIVLKETTD